MEKIKNYMKSSGPIGVTMQTERKRQMPRTFHQVVGAQRSAIGYEFASRESIIIIMPTRNCSNFYYYMHSQL